MMHMIYMRPPYRYDNDNCDRIDNDLRFSIVDNVYTIMNDHSWLVSSLVTLLIVHRFKENGGKVEARKIEASSEVNNVTIQFAVSDTIIIL